MEHELADVIQIASAGAAQPRATAPQQPNPMANRHALGFGKFDPIVRGIQTVYTPENERLTELAAAVGKLPIKAYRDWNAGYMALFFEAHPRSYSAFSEMLVRSVDLVKNKNFTPENIQAINSLEALAGSPDNVLNYMTMIRDASKSVEERKARARPRGGVQRQSLDSEPAVMPDDGMGLFRNGVTYSDMDQGFASPLPLANVLNPTRAVLRAS